MSFDPISYAIGRQAGGGGGSSVIVTPLTVTENGMYSTPSGTAYDEVTVDVPIEFEPLSLQASANEILSGRTAYDHEGNVIVGTRADTGKTLVTLAQGATVADLDVENILNQIQGSGNVYGALSVKMTLSGQSQTHNLPVRIKKVYGTQVLITGGAGDSAQASIFTLYGDAESGLSFMALLLVNNGTLIDMTSQGASIISDLHLGAYI